VVGGKNSANTVRLAELAAETGTPTFHIETSDELDLKQLRGKQTIGLTAGASTPNWMIVEVAERLKEAALRNEPPLKRHAINCIKFLLNTNLYAALGAFGMGLGCAVLYPHPARASFPFLAIVVATLYIFAMHTLNIRSERDTERYTDPLRWKFHLRFASTLMAFGLVATMGALAVSFHMNLWAFCLMSLAVITGVLHRLTFVPRVLTPFFGRRRLAEIPGSKDLFMGGAWAVTLVALPLVAQFSNGSPLDVLAQPRSLLNAGIAFFYVFTLVFIRSVVFDMREIQTDQLVGRETIPVVVGKERTKILLAAMTALLMLAMLIALWAGIFTTAGWLMLLPILYTCGYLYLFHKRAIMHGVWFEIIVGGQFLLVGLLALIGWKM
jgi:4-hydroxybenzoate polyprenyltransferase